MKPFYEDKWVKIFHGNCREVLPALDVKVDLVITSPPFNQAWYGKHHTGSQWEKHYEDDLPEDEYQEQQLEVLEMLRTASNDTGSLWYQHKNRIRHGVSMTPYQWLLKSNWIMKQEIVWFNRSSNFDKCRFYPMTERIYWSSKSVDTQFNNVISKHDDWHIFSEKANGEFKRAFPEELVNNIISCFPSDNIILDPYLGSGTTCYCAKKLNRYSIGIEINERFCELSAKRCSQEAMELNL